MGRTANVTFLGKSERRTQTASDLTLLYVVQGSADVLTQERSFRLEHEDVLALNPTQSYTLHILSGVTALIAFRHEEVYALTQGELREVNCCSVNVRDGSYNSLRFQIQTLLDSLLEERFGPISFEKQSCGLLLTLLSEFSREILTKDRKQEVALWVENVSREPITLEDAAEHFHLTPQYFSRWFPTAFGCTFLKYLSQVRCEKAQKDLLEGNASILRIAMDHGFPNAASFTKAFAQQYGETPLQYRKHHSLQGPSGVLSPQEVQPYLAREEEERELHRVRIDCKNRSQQLVPYWNRLCCLGKLRDLASLEVQNQVRELQQNLHFQSARVTLAAELGSGFFSEDRAMGFLLELGLKPLFVVDFRDYVHSKGYQNYLRELLRRLMTRFGMRRFQAELLLDSAFQRAEATAYRDAVRSLRSLFQTLRADCELLGPGLHLNSDGSNLAACLSVAPELDGVTIRCAPVGIMKSPELQMRKVPEADYLLNQYRLGREILEQCQVHKELLITGWRTSLGKLNFLNDSSWTAAKILHTALTGYGVLPSLPLEYTLDLMVEGAEESGILHAMEGMMTVHGLRKPSFYAFRFLKHLDQFFLYRDEHVLVTASAEGYVQIVLQNSAPLSHQYYLYSGEISPQPSPIPDGFFESKEPYPVRLRFTGVENGKWLMKTRTVNEELGNVFHAWMVLNYDDPSFMGRDEQELLRARSVPDIRGNTLTSRNGILDVTVTMGPNEIRHIHLLPVGQ